MAAHVPKDAAQAKAAASVVHPKARVAPKADLLVVLKVVALKADLPVALKVVGPKVDLLAVPLAAVLPAWGAA